MTKKGKSGAWDDWHKPGDYPISARFTADERDWLDARKAITGESRGQIIKRALREYRERLEQSANAEDANAVSANADSASANPPTASS